MTKNEVKALIRKKMDAAEKDYLESLVKKDYETFTYYRGVRRGLQDALQVIGMLDNDHNRLKSSL